METRAGFPGTAGRDTPGVTKPGAPQGDLEPLRRDERLLVSRLRAGIVIVFCSIAAFAVADLVVQEHLGALAAIKALQVAILVAGVALLRRHERSPRPRLLGVVVVSAVYVTTASSAAVRMDYETSYLLFVALAMGTATFVPWGPRAQLASVVPGAIAVALDAWVVRGLEPPTLSFPELAVFITFAASVWIAREHDRHRVERFLVQQELEASRRRLEEESWVSGALARVGREMISQVSAPEILRRLCELTTELLGCDASSTSMRDPREDAFVPQTAHGHAPDDWESIRVIHLPASRLAPLLAEFAADRPVQVRTSRLRDPAMAALHRQYGVRVSLYLPLRRGDEVIGILTAHQISRDEAFTPLQVRVATGIAQLASIALENARLVEELRSANTLKSEFVSTMSHELRTPVSVILGYTDMVADAESSDERAVLLARIRRSALELHELIEETLDLNRLEAGKDPPRVEWVDVRELFDELVGEFAAVASLDDVAVRWEGSLRLEIRSDRRKLRIILKNLLGNALKFTPAGEIVVHARRDADRVVLAVRDTGVGIAAEHVPIIFDMFRQADSSDARAYRGAGLGLYIVRRLTEQLGGDVRVESAPGRGSTFTIALPQTAEAPSWAGESARQEGERR